MVSSYKNGNGEGVKGVTYRDGDSIIRNPNRQLLKCLDNLPLPDYSLVPSFDEYKQACDLSKSVAILEVGRGCPHKCVYCSESIFWHRKTRTFSISRIVKEILYLRDKGAECFLLSYDQFTTKKSFVEEFCHSVLANGLHTTPWYCISRLDTVNNDLLQLMKKAGCESMCYGIDSGSENTLKFIRKRIDKDILYQRVQETTQHNLTPTLSFVVGFPEEERKDIDATLMLGLKTGIHGNSNPLMQMPTVLAGTELHQKYHHILVREVDTYFSLGLEFDEGRRLAEDDALIDSDSFLFSSFYNIPCNGVSIKELDKIVNYFPLIVNLYPKSFLLISLVKPKSVSSLFQQFLHFVGTAKNSNTLELTPADCYQYFSKFVGSFLNEVPEEIRDCLNEIVLYETCGLEAGNFTNKQVVGNVDISGVSTWKPAFQKDVIVRRFKYNLPHIIEELKAEIYLKEYQEFPVWLLFSQDGKQLDVLEINEFGHDFLNLCEDKHKLEEISLTLYSKYGDGLEYNSFLGACKDAFSEFFKLGILYPQEV